MKKGSIGVKVLGALAMVGSVISFLPLILTFLMFIVSNSFQISFVSSGRTYYKDILFGLCWLICGINIFKLINWARVLMMMLCVYQLCLVLINLVSVHTIQAFKDSLVRGSLTTYTIFMLCFSVIFIVLIFFLDRPKIREQFK